MSGDGPRDPTQPTGRLRHAPRRYSLDRPGTRSGPAALQTEDDASDDAIDHALRDALAHPKNRLPGWHRGSLLHRRAAPAACGSRHPAPCPSPPPVLRLEAEVEAFLLNTSEPQHVFPPDMSSYEVRPSAIQPASA